MLPTLLHMHLLLLLLYARFLLSSVDEGMHYLFRLPLWNCSIPLESTNYLAHIRPYARSIYLLHHLADRKSVV